MIKTEKIKKEDKTENANVLNYLIAISIYKKGDSDVYINADLITKYMYIYRMLSRNNNNINSQMSQFIKKQNIKDVQNYTIDLLTKNSENILYNVNVIINDLILDSNENIQKIKKKFEDLDLTDEENKSYRVELLHLKRDYNYISPSELEHIEEIVPDSEVEEIIDLLNYLIYYKYEIRSKKEETKKTYIASNLLIHLIARSIHINGDDLFYNSLDSNNKKIYISKLISSNYVINKKMSQFIKAKEINEETNTYIMNLLNENFDYILYNINIIINELIFEIIKEKPKMKKKYESLTNEEIREYKTELLQLNGKRIYTELVYSEKMEQVDEIVSDLEIIENIDLINYSLYCKSNYKNVIYI